MIDPASDTSSSCGTGWPSALTPQRGPSAPRVGLKEGPKSNISRQSASHFGLPAKLRYGAPQTNTTCESTSVGWSSSSGSNYAVVKLLLLIGRRHMKFIVVNGRTPRPQSFCSLCCEPIGESYLRETATRLSYCDHKCYVDRSKQPVRALQNKRAS